jgi:ADP-ribose pyrophosphatase
MPAPDRQMHVEHEALIHEGHSYRFVDLTVRYRDGVTRHKPMVRHNGAATILPLLETDQGLRIVMIRNERVTIDQVLLELPAGGIDPGEDPMTAAGRELIEETGYMAQNLEPLCRFLTTPGLTDELMHVFVARDLTHVGQKLEPYESLTVELFEPAQLMHMVDRNEITDAKTMLTLRTAHASGII